MPAFEIEDLYKLLFFYEKNIIEFSINNIFFYNQNQELKNYHILYYTLAIIL